jgi:hypothetical protein
MIFAGIVDVMLPDHLSSSNQKRFLGAIVARDWAWYQLRLIADNLSKAGWSWGCVSAVDSGGREIFIADAHRFEGKRFVMKLESAMQ